MTFKEILTDSVRYWELRRLIYIIAQAAVFSVFAITALVQGRLAISFEWCVGLLIMAVVSNVLYCVCYPVDILLQLTDFRDRWIKYRWILFAFGCIFACLVAAVVSRPVTFMCE